MPHPFPPSEELAWAREVDHTEEADSGHGRVEVRVLESTERLRDYLDWPGLAQVCRIQRRRITAKGESDETVYAITSLSRERADAKTLLRLSRGHWGIENRLHCVRDVTLREDQCRVRCGAAPQVLVALRNTVLTLLRRLGFTNIAEGVEHFQENRNQAFNLVRYGRIE